ncbi:MAG: DUF1269 domain-containing protein [Actinobacteria bacterium]|nr:DUF1269 domain-containing protein [Actinomycetota bacterium]
MSQLIAIAYDNRQTAEDARLTLRRLHLEDALQLDDAVIVTRDGAGRIKLHQWFRPAEAGAAGGALGGTLIGLLFLAPLLGALLGGAAGAAVGARTDVGVDDSFARQLGERLEPGKAALLVLLRESTPDKVLPEIEQYGGHILQTSLSDEAEELLREAVGEQRSGAGQSS